MAREGLQGCWVAALLLLQPCCHERPAALPDMLTLPCHPPSQDGRLLLSIDSGHPSLSLGPSQLPAATAAPVAVWLGWGKYRRRLALPRSFSGDQELHLVLVR